MIRVNFINERFKGSHFGFTNALYPYKLENIFLDFVALKEVSRISKIKSLGDIIR